MDVVTKIALAATVAVVIMVFANYRVATNPVTYMLLVLIVIASFVSNASGQQNSLAKMTVARIRKKEDGTIQLGETETKFLIFYILTQLDKKEVIDMSELAGELNISIYELTDVIRFLGKHQAVEVIYPPMQNFPIIRKGNREKSNSIRMSIYNKQAKKSILGEAKMDEFAKEVNEYVEAMRRKSTYIR